MLEPQIIIEPNLHAVDLTMGQKWMQLELPRLGVRHQGFTNVGFLDGNRKNWKPHVVGSFTSAPFRDGAFSLILFDPPFLLRRDEKYIEGKFRYPINPHHPGVMSRFYGKFAFLMDPAYLGTWRRVEEMRDGIRGAWSEIARISAPGGEVIAKWGDGCKKVEWFLAQRPRTLRVERVNRRPSRGGSSTTFYIWLRKEGPSAEPPDQAGDVHRESR